MSVRPYDIVNSFQGSFGPPTLGHMDAMRIALEQTILSYPGKRILMLFMPTYKSSSKPHLLPTTKARIDALNIYCNMLKLRLEKSQVTNVDIEASDLEYTINTCEEDTELCQILRSYGKPDGSTDTIWTIVALRHMFPTSKIILTMGEDLKIQLPYWNCIEYYNTFLRRPGDDTDNGTIYIVPRNEDSAEPGQTTKTIPELKGGKEKFNATLWKKTLEYRLQEPLRLMNGVPLPTGVRADTINSIDFVKLNREPLPTSSSMLRCALYQHYEHKLPGSERQIQKLTGIVPMFDDPWHASHMAIRDDADAFRKCTNQAKLYTNLFKIYGGKTKRNLRKHRKRYQSLRKQKKRV